MSFLRDNTTAALKGQDVYTSLSSMLTTEGWVQVGAVITISTVDWYIWRNPSANSGLSKDFHVAIGVPSDGANLRFRLFEDWTGVGDKVNRPAPSYNPTLISAGGGLYKDSYDLAIAGTSSNPAAVPWTPGTGSFARAGGDYSVGVFDSMGSKADSNLDTALNNAPHDFHINSEVIEGHWVKTGDDTACEYVIHVNAQAFMLASRTVFSNIIEGIYVGAYEPVHVLDPMPIVISRLQSRPDYSQGSPGPTFMGSWTRWWGFDGAVPSSQGNWDVEGSAYSWAGGGIKALSYLDGRIQTDFSTQSESNMSGYYDALAKGVPMSRVGLIGYEGSSYLSAIGIRSVLYGPVMAYEVNTQGPPSLNFGDEVTVNGVDYYFIGCVASYGLDDGQNAPSANDRDPLFLPKL